jgi:hypothetical protein
MTGKLFHWTRETSFPGWTLRDAQGLARGVVIEQYKDDRKVFHGQIFAANLPTSMFYDCVDDAACWVCRRIAEENLVPGDNRVEDNPLSLRIKNNQEPDARGRMQAGGENNATTNT